MPSQVFSTAGSATWTWPAGVTTVTAECLGAGGGGGAASGNPASGGGGRGGTYARATITKGAEASLSLVVGTTSQGSYVERTPGGTKLCTATGGLTGGTGSADSSNGAGANNYNAVLTPLGDVIFHGGDGGTGTFPPNAGGSGAGGGAAGPAGAGGNASVNTGGTAGPGTFLNGVVYQAAGRAGVTASSQVGLGGAVYGAAGAGGRANTVSDRAGGAGGQGIIVMTWAAPPQPIALIL